MTVTCTAGPAGEEVVQLWTALTTPSQSIIEPGNVDTRSIPLKELKGFQRVSVPAARQADSRVEVSFVLALEDLELMDTDGVMKVRRHGVCVHSFVFYHGLFAAFVVIWI